MSNITTANLPTPSQFITAQDTFSGLGSSAWIKVTGTIIVHVTGNSYVSAIVERSATDPSGTPTPAPVFSISGDGNTGISPSLFNEPYVAWWRVRITQLNTGSTIQTTIMGGAA